MNLTTTATSYHDINSLLGELLARMQLALGPRLVGLYLYGSLVWGDFDRGSSDIDLLAATSSLIDEAEFARLNLMQDELSGQYKDWEGRIEIAYVSLNSLRNFKTQSSPLAIISPGEPFHLKEAGRDWLINWYAVQEKGVPLYGPPPEEIIEPVSKQEFIQAVHEQALEWRKSILKARYWRPGQDYAILTMCRALFAHTKGEQATKLQAARWVQEQLPQWAELVENALLWREQYRKKLPDHAFTYPQTEEFVNFIIDYLDSRCKSACWLTVPSA